MPYQLRFNSAFWLNGGPFHSPPNGKAGWKLQPTEILQSASPCPLVGVLSPPTRQAWSPPRYVDLGDRLVRRSWTPNTHVIHNQPLRFGERGHILLAWWISPTKGCALSFTQKKQFGCNGISWLCKYKQGDWIGWTSFRGANTCSQI